MIGEQICENIREIRKSLKLTQSQFAELVNMSEDSVGKIERCVTIPTLETLEKISKGIKQPLSELLSVTKETMQTESAELEDFITYLKTLSPEDVTFLHEVAVKILERAK